MGIPVLVEGYLESVFLPVVLKQIGRSDLQPVIRNAGGGTKFWPIARQYNEAGKHMAVIGLADLEQIDCAPTLLAVELPRKSGGFHLRLAVRMLESWLLADRARLASFLKVPATAIPIAPDALRHPKRELVNISRKSTSRLIREAMIPEDSGGVVGPDYVATMSEFICTHWQVAVARATSPSLERACVRWLAI
jgi:hypothetical protein